MKHHRREVDETAMQAYNEVLLEGIPTGTPERSHENHGQVFYRQFIEVPRLSGTADLLPMLLRQEQLAGVHSGEPLRIDGQLRSFNNRTVTGRRLILTVYGKALLPPTGEAVNQIILSGTLCKPPVYRRTPLGRSICDLLLAVPRALLSLKGRIQSRIYRKVTDTGTEERTAYEVSVMNLLDTPEL